MTAEKIPTDKNVVYAICEPCGIRFKAAQAPALMDDFLANIDKSKCPSCGDHDNLKIGKSDYDIWSEKKAKDITKATGAGS